jgi:hypothetical protein
VILLKPNISIIKGGTYKTSYKTYILNYNGSALTLKNYINYNNHSYDNSLRIRNVFKNFFLSLVNCNLLKDASSNNFFIELAFVAVGNVFFYFAKF